MKKNLLFSLAATALLAGCNGDEVVDMADSLKPQAISFENPFVDKATKADLTTNDLTNFYVYSTKNGSLDFNGQAVTGSGGKGGTYTYEPLKYWDKTATYKFIAYSDGNASTTSAKFETTPNLKFENYTVDNIHQKDLIYSELISRGVGENTKVAFTFKHLLSKVKFSFRNGIDENTTLTISNIKFTAKKTGTYNSSWSLGETTENYTYNNVSGIEYSASAESYSASNYSSSTEKFVIPQPVSGISVSFTVTATNTNIPSNQNSKDFTVDLSTLGDWENGYKYNYYATISGSSLDLAAIEFSVETITDWVSKDVEATPTPAQ